MSSFQFSEESQSHFLSEPAEKISSSSASASTPPRNKKSGGENATKKDKKKSMHKSLPDVETGKMYDNAAALGVKIKKDKDGRPALKRPDRTGKVKKLTRSTGSGGSSSFQRQGKVAFTLSNKNTTNTLNVSFIHSFLDNFILFFKFMDTI